MHLALDLKIIHFSRDYTPHDHRFLSKMVETGHQIFYLRLENAGRPYEDRPLPEGVTNIRWAGGQRIVTWRDGPALVRDLRRVIREYRPDLIQAGPIQTAAFLVALAGFKNLVTMSWGYDLLIDAGKGKAWRWATRYTLKRAAAFVGDCATIRDLAIGHGMDPKKIVTFPWGANIRKYHPVDRKAKIENRIRARRGWSENEFVILSTRSWAPLYGVADLVRAFIAAARQLPELRLLMLAGGPLSPRIKAMVHNAGLIDRVHFPGQIAQRDLPDYYRAADLYVSTSHSDGTSISLLEALASGLPVLVADIPGNREWISPSLTPSPPAPLPRGERGDFIPPLPQTPPPAKKSGALFTTPPSPRRGRGAGGEGGEGWLFRRGDHVNLERRILEIVERREELEAIGENARRLAEARGDWDKNFPKLLKAWELVSTS